MAKLTTTQITELVDNGNIQRRLENEAYVFHKFSGYLDGCYYECATPQTHDLGLDETTTKVATIAAYKAHFKTMDHKGIAPVIQDSTDW